MKILLSAGHGGTDSGSIGADKGKEKDRTINLANKVASYLRNAGHNVTVNTEKTSSGAWRFKNRSGYDFALSIHFNAFNGSATGTECWYKGTRKKASALSSAVANVLGIKNRGAKATTALYMMNIGFDNLIEVCFHDNSSDLNKYNSKIDAVAKAIADAVNGSATGSSSSASGSSSSSYSNNSIVDYLNSIGVDSSFSNRKKLAQANGISNYTGTASQNLQLLNILRNGNTSTTTSTSNTSSYTGTSIVDYLKSIGQDSSFSNRKKLAEANGISNYTGTASQNTQLLNILRGSASSSASTSYYSKYTGSSSSLVDALKAVEVDSSYNNRAKIAKANGISNYTGTASQNTKLLNLLKQGKLKK